MGTGTEPNWSRRRFLGATGMGAIGVVLAARGLSESQVLANPAFPDDPFALGVASGDPLPHGVVLWTRLAPQPLAADGRGGMPERSVPVMWQVAEDEGFTRIVRRGTEVARPALGHSVHAEVTGLRPFRPYYYRFKVGDALSPVARTKTAPARGASIDHLAFALGSCQSWVGGRYASYGDMARQDLDLMVHVGDYIYERPGTASLSDFRNLHAQYKTSPDLQAAHASFPFVVTFDDHEVDNNWADEIPQDDTPNFMELRANAFQAYYEHMPLRLQAKPEGPDMRLYRKLTYGSLAELNVLDTRQYRDDQLGGSRGPHVPGELEASRTLTGEKQERWLFENLDRSSARWNIIAQQTMMAQYDYDTSEALSVNHDQWDGYVAPRDRMVDFIERRRPANPVVLTGDWHVSMVNDITTTFADSNAPTVATEFLGNSLSSGGTTGPGWGPDMAAALAVNPHVKHFSYLKRGYLLSTLTPEEWRSDFREVADPADSTGAATTATSWVVENGRPGAQPA